MAFGRSSFGTATYDNLANFPSAGNRASFSGSTLTWIGPLAGGPSTSADVAQQQVLGNSVSITTTSPGQTIQNLNIAGQILVNHANVVIKRCRIVDDHNTNGVIRAGAGGSGLLVEDCEIDGSGSSSYGINNRQGGSGSTYRRCNIHGFENGIDPGDNDTVVDCYIWGMLNTNNVDPHYDNIEFDGGTGLTVQHNHLLDEQDDNATINLDNQFDVLSNVLVNNNLCIGAHFTIWIDATKSANAVSNISITNNRLGEGTGEPGLDGYFNFNGFTPVHTGNVDYLTLVSVD